MKSPTSMRFLLGLFIIALPVFILLRWDYSAWLTTEINQAAKNAGITLHYDNVSLSGLGISFKNIQLSTPESPKIQCNELTASLSLSSLFSGSIAADMDILWETNPVSFTVSQNGELIEISAVEAMIDLERLSAYQQNIPARLSGLVSANGVITLNRLTRQVHTGQLEISWHQAMAGLAQPEFTLGDYKLNLNSAETADQPWHWEISGGSGLALDGQGSLSPQHPDPKQWVFSGELAVQVDDTNPALAMMMQTFAGSKQTKLRLSGTLLNPRTDIIR